jgi:hypothetical protein
MIIHCYYLTAIVYYLLDTLISTNVFFTTASTAIDYQNNNNNNDNDNNNKAYKNDINDSIVRNIPSYQRQALHDLYDATKGYDWEYPYGDRGHWNFTDDNVNPCSTTDPWQGLSCKSSLSSSPSNESSSILEFDYITTIELPHYQLKGYIPSSIDQIKTLILLNLSSNSVTNTIPNTIGIPTESSSHVMSFLHHQFHFYHPNHNHSHTHHVMIIIIIIYHNSHIFTFS